MQNNSVNECIFHFLGARIWAPIPVYRYENPSRYITEKAKKLQLFLSFQNSFLNVTKYHVNYERLYKRLFEA